MADKLYVEVLNWASSFLEEKGLEPYLGEYLLLERQGWTKTDLVLVLREVVPTEILNQWQADLAEAVKGLPPQYIIGSCEFYGRRFKVTTETLIPRPETEELVQRCLTEEPTGPCRVLDIGTGTGVIALTLKKERPSWQVTAVDISLGALDVAQANAQALGANVNLLHSDLTAQVAQETFDVIISNPPYIAAEEWSVMGASVREHEPREALFAANHGLAIYERLAEELPGISHEGTAIYLEIGYRQGAAVTAIFAKAMPQKRIEVAQDLFGQDRMVIIK